LWKFYQPSAISSRQPSAISSPPCCDLGLAFVTKKMGGGLKNKYENRVGWVLGKSGVFGSMITFWDWCILYRGA
jgi:hypothetical protein